MIKGEEMSIGIVIVTHNESAKALLDTTEMICGKQENIIAINFYPNMDNLALLNKMKEKIKNLDIKDGIIFLVDIFGGTPFNTAFLLSKEYKNSFIISGVNIPMIIESCEIREEKMELEKKIDLIKKVTIDIISGIETNRDDKLEDE